MSYSYVCRKILADRDRVLAHPYHCQPATEPDSCAPLLHLPALKHHLSKMKPTFLSTSVVLAALATRTIAHNIQMGAHSRECFHEQLHKDDKMTVTFQVGDREFGGAGNLEIDFWVRTLPPLCTVRFAESLREQKGLSKRRLHHITLALSTGCSTNY